MTLSDMVDFICGKVNQTEAEDKAACKSFLTQQHETLWHSQLWKDSLVSFTQTLAPTGYTPSSNWLPTKGVLVLPSIIERVLAVRTDSRKLNIRRPEFYYRVDYDAFAKTGNAAEFMVLPACAWEFDASYSLYVNRGAASDNALKVTVDSLLADGISIERDVFTMDTPSRFIAATDRIDAAQKNSSDGVVTITPDNITAVNNSPDPVDFRWLTTIDGDGDPGTAVANGTSILLGPRVSGFVGAFPVGFGGAPNAAVAVPLGFYGTLALNSAGNTLTAVPAVVPISVPAADTAARLRQRIRLVEIPGSNPSSITIRVLGKRQVTSFSDDLDQPIMNGFVQPLLALGQAEMLERERQYGKAQAKKQEGITLLQELIAVETVQQSHQTQIIPECGYGDDVFGGGHAWGFTF